MPAGPGVPSTTASPGGPSLAPAARVCEKVLVNDIAAPGERAIDVFLADDNLIVREGVRAIIERHADLRVVGVAADYDEVVSGATATEPQVLVTDVRMPPSFHREGIDAAKEVRKRPPGDRGRGAAPSTTTPSTRSRCWRRARPATATC